MCVHCVFIVPILLFAWGRQEPAAAPADIQGRVSLARAATCESLTRSVQDTAVRQMRSQLDAAQGTAPPPGPIVTAGAEPPQAAGQPASYSTTNVQVAG